MTPPVTTATQTSLRHWSEAQASIHLAGAARLRPIHRSRAVEDATCSEADAAQPGWGGESQPRKGCPNLGTHVVNRGKFAPTGASLDNAWPQQHEADSATLPDPIGWSGVTELKRENPEMRLWRTRPLNSAASRDCFGRSRNRTKLVLPSRSNKLIGPQFLANIWRTPRSDTPKQARHTVGLPGNVRVLCMPRDATSVAGAPHGSADATGALHRGQKGAHTSRRELPPSGRCAKTSHPATLGCSGARTTRRDNRGSPIARR